MSTPSASSFRRADPGQAALAAALGLVLFTAAWGLLHVGFWADDRIVDTPVYERYAERMLEGEVPYRDFAVEYPPAALPVFLLPALLPGDDYESSFELLMWTCGAAGLLSLVLALTAVGADSRRLLAAVTFAALAPLALGSLLLTRFDLWPAALTVGALAALVAGRNRLGFGLLAVGVGAKWFPGVLVPLALVWVWRRRGRLEALWALWVFVAVLAVILLPFAVVSPGGLADSLGAQLGRPLQIESLGAGFLLAAHQLGWYEPTVVSSHGSQNLAGSLPDALAALQTAVQALALAAVWALFARIRPEPERLFAASAAALVAFVAFGKVLSPQFLVWLLPVVPLVAGGTGLAACLVLLAALVTTQGWFPHRYWDVVDLDAVGWLVLGRDLLLVALFGLLMFGLRTRFTTRR